MLLVQVSDRAADYITGPLEFRPSRRARREEATCTDESPRHWVLV